MEGTETLGCTKCSVNEAGLPAYPTGIVDDVQVRNHLHSIPSGSRHFMLEPVKLTSVANGRIYAVKKDQLITMADPESRNSLRNRILVQQTAEYDQHLTPPMIKMRNSSL